jgi:hypothetical protein
MRCQKTAVAAVGMPLLQTIATSAEAQTPTSNDIRVADPQPETTSGRAATPP